MIAMRGAPRRGAGKRVAIRQSRSMNIRPESSKAQGALRTCARVALIAATFWCAVPAAGEAASVTIEWDQNSDAVTTGYFVYYGTEPGKYSGNVDVGTSTSAVVNLTDSEGTYYLAVQAYSATGERGPVSAELVWKSTAPSPQAPTLRNPGSMTTVAGQSVNVQLSASDPAGLALNYSAAGLPSGLQVAASTGLISGTPSNPGAYNVTATVANTNGLSASQSFTWTILTQPSSPGAGGTLPGSPGAGGTLPGGGVGNGTGGGSVISEPIAGGGGGSGGGTGTGGGGGITDGGGATTTPTAPAEDRTPPVVSIISPSSGGSNYRTTNTKMIVTGLASDNIGVVSVVWTNSRGGGGSALGTGSWATSPIDLQLGGNIIAVTASDAAGNVHTVTVTITRIVDLENYLN